MSVKASDSPPAATHHPAACSSQHHIKFPGTLSATSETHLLLMMDTIASLADNGFVKFCILNAHGGNSQGISVLLQRCAQTPPTVTPALPPFTLRSPSTG